MPKFYVRSGELEKIVTARNPKRACEKALDLTQGETLGEYFYVDERGFRSPTTTMDTTVVTVDQLNGTVEELKPQWAIPTEEIIHIVGDDNE